MNDIVVSSCGSDLSDSSHIFREYSVEKVQIGELGGFCAKKEACVRCGEKRVSIAIGHFGLKKS